MNEMAFISIDSFFFPFLFLRNFFCRHPENHTVMREWEWGEKILMQGRMTAKKLCKDEVKKKKKILQTELHCRAYKLYPPE